MSDVVVARIVDEDSEGMTIRGAKMPGTSSIMANKVSAKTTPSPVGDAKPHGCHRGNGVHGGAWAIGLPAAMLFRRAPSRPLRVAVQCIALKGGQDRW
jgi:hypothetical protein